MSLRPASLPMYDWPEIREETDRLWEAIRDQFRNAGIDAPDNLLRDVEGFTHWRDPDLLFSQTCGYPYATKLLNDVELLGTPVYGVEGCYGPNYSSAIVVRSDESFASLEECEPCRLVYNSLDSLSGYRCLTSLVGDPLQHFALSAESGGHRASARMVASGEADIAAIDAVCWHLLREVEPGTAERLRVLRWGPLFPSLPYITVSGRSSDQIASMRAAIKTALRSVNSEASSLPLQDVEMVTPQAYTPLALL